MPSICIFPPFLSLVTVDRISVFSSLVLSFTDSLFSWILSVRSSKSCNWNQRNNRQERLILQLSGAVAVGKVSKCLKRTSFIPSCCVICSSIVSDEDFSTLQTESIQYQLANRLCSTDLEPAKHSKPVQCADLEQYSLD